MAAPLSGDNGSLLVSASSGGTYTAVGSVRDCSVSQSGTMIDAWRRASGSWAVNIPGRRSATVSVSAVWDDADAQLMQMLGAYYATPQTLLYYEYRFETASGQEKYTFSGYVSDVSMATPSDAVSTLDMTITVTGAITAGTQ